MSATKKTKVFLSPPWVGREERAAVSAAFDSGYVAPCGPQVEAFERELAKLSGRKYAVAVSSGTAALDLLMEEFKVGPDTTVIAPTLTFVATVGPAWHRGARIVFVDCDFTGCMMPECLEEALSSTSGKRLVISVDLYRRCCRYDVISCLCRKHRVPLISDSAEAVGATRHGKPAGTAGVAAVYSFNGNKIITTSGGGAILTDSKGIAERAAKRAQQSRERKLWYEHREVGYNYRMSNLLAAVGLAQLRKLPTILGRRRAREKAYGRAFALLPAVEGQNNWLTVALLDSKRERDALIRRLAAKGCESRPVWKPLHLQPVFRGCRVIGGKVAESLFERGVCLPSGTGMTPRQIAEVIACK